MKKRFLFIIILLTFFIPKSFGIEEIVPDFSEEIEQTEQNEVLEGEVSETFVEKVFGQKEINLGNDFLNKVQFGVNYQGRVDMTHYDEENRLSTKYPFTFEPYVHLHSKESKNQLRVSFLMPQSISFDRHFAGHINDAYIIRKFNKDHEVWIGNSRTPVGIEGGSGAYTLNFVKRSQIASNFGNTRSLGIKFKGSVKMFDYNIGVYSSTRKLQHPCEGGELVGWIDYKPFYKKEGPLQNLRFGTGVDYGRRGNNYTVLSSGVTWDYKKWYVAGEYGFAQNYNGANGFKQGKAQGANGTVAYNLTDKIQILGRYDIFNPDMNHNGKYKTQYTAGVNYFVFKNRIKFALNYIFEQQKHNNKNMIMLLTQILI